MISTAAGPRLPHCLNAGHVYELSEELGAELVKERAAVEVPNPRKAAAVETAAIDAGEKAIAEGSEEKSKKGDEAKKPDSLIDKLTSPEKSEKGEKTAEKSAEKPSAKK